jgi:predicted PolB exonuclease-like 3'-5' exonuclease
MLDRIQLENILFLDLETVPEQPSFDLLEPEVRELWDLKTRNLRKEEVSPEEYYERAGIWAEFGKIVCISAGFFTGSGAGRRFRIRSFTGSEENILITFSELLNTHYSGNRKFLCAHNGKEFDYPYLARRILIHGLPLPEKLNLFGKKPWEIPHLDTMELWKFGDFRNYTSLRLLAQVLGVPSPKVDLDGSMVSSVYYQERDLERIVRYCELDVITTARVFLRMRGEPMFPDERIMRVGSED